MTGMMVAMVVTMLIIGLFGMSDGKMHMYKHMHDTKTHGESGKGGHKESKTKDNAHEHGKGKEEKSKDDQHKHEERKEESR